MPFVVTSRPIFSVYVQACLSLSVLYSVLPSLPRVPFTPFPLDATLFLTSTDRRAVSWWLRAESGTAVGMLLFAFGCARKTAVENKINSNLYRCSIGYCFYMKIKSEFVGIRTQSGNCTCSAAALTPSLASGLLSCKPRDLREECMGYEMCASFLSTGSVRNMFRSHNTSYARDVCRSVAVLQF